jgi:acyl carrier protein
LIEETLLMDKEAFMEDLAGVLDVDRSEINEGTPLKNADNWDSIAHLAAIAAIDERFGITVPAKELTGVRTVGELIALVERAVSPELEDAP